MNEDERAALAEQIADGGVTFDVDRAGQVELPPPAAEGEVMVVCSLRLPVEAYQRIKDTAASKGIRPTALMRDWIQEGLAGSESDRTISVADLLRAVARLPEHPGRAA